MLFNTNTNNTNTNYSVKCTVNQRSCCIVIPAGPKLHTDICSFAILQWGRDLEE